MNSGQRRMKKRLGNADAAGGMYRASPQPSEVTTKIGSRWPFLKTLLQAKKAVTATVGFLTTVLSIYAGWPSWTVTSPTAAYNPQNPFTGVFNVTNTGYLPAYDVHVHCVQQQTQFIGFPMIDANLPTNDSLVGDFSKGDVRSFSCPESIAGVRSYDRSLSAEEVARESNLMRLEGNTPLESRPQAAISQLDLEIVISYKLLATFSKRLRFIGKPALDRSFIWEQAEPKKETPSG